MFVGQMIFDQKTWTQKDTFIQQMGQSIMSSRLSKMRPTLIEEHIFCLLVDNHLADKHFVDSHV